MSILIFGASGFLGRELRNYFETKHKTVLGTYFANNQPGLIHFDLKHTDLDIFGTDLKKVRFAIICGATTTMDSCKADWAGTYRVNVEGTTALISRLQACGIIPVFISTDAVYDGTRCNSSEDDVRVPALAYGRQKKEVEDFLFSRGGLFIIVRLGRIYSLRERDKTIITTIANDLRKGRDLRLATDQIFSPSYVEDICRALGLLIEKRCLGCYNVCAGEPISRFELGVLVKARLGIKTGHVIPCTLSDFNFEDNRPLDTSMSNKRFIETTGFRFTTLAESLARLKQMGVKRDAEKLSNH